jgi:uncharacterized membrane protein (UPF0127 family)
MSTTPARSAAALTLCVLLFAAHEGGGAEPARFLEGFARAQIIIETRQACYLIDLYVAETPEERAQGLMYIRELGEFEGMLFPASAPAVVNMWMKNTYIPLDMLFIRANGTIARIAAETTPLSEDTISSGEPVTAVLELNGGFAKRHDVRSGDRFRIVP